MDTKGVVACFTPEVAISQSLHTYSGGLGVVKGSFFASCRRLNIPVIGITILPRQGYYDQGVDEKQRVMTINYVNRMYEGILKRSGLNVSIEVCDKPIHIEVWELASPRIVPIYFLDADVEQNDPLSRLNTLQLYGGNMERMIAQSLILGRGGLEVLKQLGMPVWRYHVDESYGVFALCDLLADAVQNGMDPDQAIASVRARSVFTTHTPIPAGNPDYSSEAVMRLSGYGKTIGQEIVQRLAGENSFNATAACMRLCGKVNTVSRKHLRIAERQWAWVREASPFCYITNGKDPEFWQDSACKDAQTPGDLQFAKEQCHQRLQQYIQEQSGRQLLGNQTLTIGWARRFEEYKRPWLLFSDRGWLQERLSRGTFQLVMAGKPHPDNTPMINTWNWLYRLSFQLPNLIVLPGYELEMMRTFQQGTHMWANTPATPNEACGSSGMGNAQNGGIHLSTPDGWACEQDPENNMLFGTPHPLSDQHSFDAAALRQTVDYAAWIFYHEPRDWWIKALRAKKEAETQWSSDRMAAQYAQLMYDL
ncbi:MAG: hypothetical protein HY006_02245 [Candidatus Sungbacteria bacterium]|nr:hypothetical protein [Candidatus Sungbacteria bacterium]